MTLKKLNIIIFEIFIDILLIIIIYNIKMEKALVNSLERGMILINFKTIGGNTIYGSCDPKTTTIKIMYDAVRNNYDVKEINPENLLIKTFNETNQEVIFDEKSDTILNDYMESKDMCLEKNAYAFNIVDKRVNIYKDQYDNEIKNFKENYSDTKTYIYCEFLTGKKIKIPYKPYMTIIDLKIGIMIKAGIPIDQQRICFRSVQLENNRICATYNICAEDTVNLLLSLRGGMYHESSGRNGGFGPLKGIFFTF